MTVCNVQEVMLWAASSTASSSHITLTITLGSGLEKTPVRLSATSRFSLRASNLLSFLPPWARTQASRSPTKFLIAILREKVSFRLKGNQVFRWRLTKITIYSVVLLIVWCTLMPQKWLPSMWSKSAAIEFLSRIKIAALGMKTLYLFLNFRNFLLALFSFSLQNLPQQRNIKDVRARFF